MGVLCVCVCVCGEKGLGGMPGTTRGPCEHPQTRGHTGTSGGASLYMDMTVTDRGDFLFSVVSPFHASSNFTIGDVQIKRE